MGFPSCICLSVSITPFGLTVVPIQFCRRMNRNGGWQAYQIARLFAILITRVTIDDAVISIIIHVHTYVNAWSECELRAQGKTAFGKFSTGNFMGQRQHCALRNKTFLMKHSQLCKLGVTSRSLVEKVWIKGLF